MILCCWYFDTGSYSDVDKQVNVQVWDNFLALATSAITSASTDQSQCYVLNCQAGTAVVHQRGQSYVFLSMIVWTVEAWVGSLAREHAEG